MEKKSLSNAAVIKIILAILICLLLMGGVTGLSYCGFTGLRFWGGDFGNVWGSGNGWRYGNSSDYNAGSGSVSAAGISNLAVDWTFGSLRVTPYSGNDIQITETIAGPYSRKDQVHWLAVGDTLYVRAAEPGFFGCSAFMGNKEVEIKVPQSMADNLQGALLNATSGDVEVSGLECANLSVNITSGSTTLHGSTAQTARLTASSGSFKADGLQADVLYLELTSGSLQVDCVSDEIHIDTTSGEANVKDTIAPKVLNVDTTSGNVTVNIPENPGFKATIDKTSGDFQCGFPVTQSGDVYSYKDGQAQYRFKTTSGNIRLLPI
jgi:hypothetical protein